MWAVPSCVCCFLLKFFHRVLLNLKEKRKFAPDVGSVNNAIWQTAGGESPTMPRWGTDVTVNKHLCHHKPARKKPVVILYLTSIFTSAGFCQIPCLSLVFGRPLSLILIESNVYTYKSRHSHILSNIMSLAFTCSSVFPPEKVTSHNTVWLLF